jgi:hypothetical protein
MAAATAIPVTFALSAIGISFRRGGHYLGLLVFVISHDRFGSG